ncbi:sperm surface protein Sp17 [Folsomia candida]|nr:sperm surface protein Sp17 [Folsomia candida]
MAAHELPEMPNGPVMELHGQRKRFHVPHGLKPLLEEITREILRYQPNDIYAFLSKFMESKLAKREAASKEKRNSGNRRWNSLEGPDLLDLAELDELLDELNISKDIADKHATKIQAAFRGHRARRSLTEKGKTIHKDHRKSWEWKKWSWEGPSTLDNDQLQEFLEELNVDLESANKHATKIQAAFRGHAVRR